MVDEREKYWIAFYDSSNRNKGYNRDSGGNLNKRLSEDLKRELSKKHKGLYDVPVLQYDLHGIFLKEWPSQRSVLDELGISVNACCKGRQKTAGGFQWKYSDDPRVIGVYVKEKHPMSEETKLKLSKAKKGKPSKLKGRDGMKGTSNPRATPILQFNLNDKFIKEWDYITQASKELGINLSSLSECLKGKQKTAGGYKWKYK